MIETKVHAKLPEVGRETLTQNEAQDLIFYDILEDIKRTESIEFSDDEFDQINTSDEERAGMSDDDDDADDDDKLDKTDSKEILLRVTEERLFTNVINVDRLGTVDKGKYLGILRYDVENKNSQILSPMKTKIALPSVKITVDKNGLIGVNADSNNSDNFRDNMQVDLKENTAFTETKNASHVCDICSQKYQTRLKLYRHLISHAKVITNRNGQAYQCQICNKRFKKNKSFRLHLNIHTGHNSHFCKYCGSSYYLKGSLTCHLKEQHGVEAKRYHCPFATCRKTFSSAKYCKVHADYHKGIRHKCDICDQTFSVKETLKLHMKFHAQHVAKHELDIEVSEDPTKFQTDVTVCKTELPSELTLDNNKLLDRKTCHIEKTTPKCNICNRNFKRAYDLNKHLRILHRDEENKKKVVQCTLCDKYYSSAGSRKRHWREYHQGQYWYLCTSNLRDQSTTSHRDQSTTNHQDQSTTSHWDRSTTRHRDQYTTNHRDQSTTSHQDQSTTIHRDQSTTSHRDQSTTSYRDQSTTSHRDQSTTSHRNQSTSCKAMKTVNGNAPQTSGSENCEIDNFYNADERSELETVEANETVRESGTENEMENIASVEVTIENTDQISEPVADKQSLPDLEPVADTQSLPDLEPVADTQSLPELEPVADTQSLPDLETVANTRLLPDIDSVADTQSLPDLEPVADTQSLPDLEPVADTQSLPDLEPVADTQLLPDLEPVADKQSLPDLESDVDMLEQAVLTTKANTAQSRKSDFPVKKQLDLLSCDICNKVLKTVRSLSRHKREFHIVSGQLTQFKCDICDKFLKSKRTLYEHVSYFHNSKNKCLECNKSFTRKTYLTKHNQKVHGVNNSNK